MTCRTILLRDDPSPNDEFGAHQLEGPWGSGKSSIVDFVRQDLHPDGRFELVVFDAWAHEGDPLRRSFLEKLSDRLKDRHWISSHRHEQLRSRGRTTGRFFNETPILKNMSTLERMESVSISFYDGCQPCWSEMRSGSSERDSVDVLNRRDAPWQKPRVTILLCVLGRNVVARHM